MSKENLDKDGFVQEMMKFLDEKCYLHPDLHLREEIIKRLNEFQSKIAKENLDAKLFIEKLAYGDEQSITDSERAIYRLALKDSATPSATVDVEDALSTLQNIILSMSSDESVIFGSQRISVCDSLNNVYRVVKQLHSQQEKSVQNDADLDAIAKSHMITIVSLIEESESLPIYDELQTFITDAIKSAITEALAGRWAKDEDLIAFALTTHHDEARFSPHFKKRVEKWLVQFKSERGIKWIK